MTDDDTIAEGWYTDAFGMIRWWDGTQWTDHVRRPGDEDATTAVLPAADHSEAAPRRTERKTDDDHDDDEPDHKRRLWLTATVVGLLAFFLGMSIGGYGSPDPAVIDDATASSGATTEDLDRREAELESREGDLTSKQNDLDQREQDLESRARELEDSPTSGGSDSIGNGVFEVGADVQPGEYASQGPEDPELPCSYRVSSDAEGDEILSSKIVEGPGTVVLEEGQFFTSEYCEQWTLQ